MKINLQSTSETRWMASCGEDANQNRFGNSQAEAIGNLILANSQTMGIELKIYDTFPNSRMEETK